MRQKGFTLVELLVAIGIIGILSSIAVVSVSNVRAKARDAKRVGDIKQIQTALESYMNDKGEYPSYQGELGTGVKGSEINKLCGSDKGFQKEVCGVENTHLAQVPKNPTPGKDVADQYIYASKNEADKTKVCAGGDEVCVEYSIVFKLESGSGTLTKGTYQANENGIVRTDIY